MDLIIIEWVWVIIIVLTIFGFMDRMFLIFAILLNWATALVALTDGYIVTDKVYSVASSSWIEYHVSTISATNVPAEPILILIVLVALDLLIFFGRSIGR